MEYYKALEIAYQVKEQLDPHCFRCEIAGSIRRRKPEPNDIDIVVLAKPYDIKLLKSGIATVLDEWETVVGKLPGKYIRKILPQGIELDIWFAEETNWGNLFAFKTGSEGFNIQVLIWNLKKQGYKCEGGFITKDRERVPVFEEADLFKLAGLPFIAPEKRKR